MKKVIVCLFVLGFTISSHLSAKSVLDNLGNIESLKNDKEFINFYNKEFNFIVALSKSKKLPLFQKFLEQTATKNEIAELLKVTDFVSEESLKNFFTNQQTLFKKFSTNYSFLKTVEGQNVLSIALTESAKEGKFDAFKKVGVVDCIAVFMINSAFCYGTYETCINENGNNCVAWMSACLALMFATYESCHDLELDL